MPKLTSEDEMLVSYFYERAVRSQAPAPTELPVVEIEFVDLTIETEQSATSGPAHPVNFDRIWQQALSRAEETISVTSLEEVESTPIPWNVKNPRAYWPLTLVAGMALAIIAGIIILLAATQFSSNQLSSTPTALTRIETSPTPSPTPKANFNGLDLAYPNASSLTVKPNGWPFNNPSEAITNYSRFAFGSSDTPDTILDYYRQKLAGSVDFMQPRTINAHQLNEGLVAFKGKIMLVVNVFPASRRGHYNDSTSFFSLFNQLQADQTLFLITYGQAVTLPDLPDLTYPGMLDLKKFDPDAWPDLGEPFATYEDYTILRPEQTVFATGNKFGEVVDNYKNKLIGAGYEIIYDTNNAIKDCPANCQQAGTDIFIAIKKARIIIFKFYDSPAKRPGFKPEELRSLAEQGLKPEQTLVSYTTGMYDAYSAEAKPLPDLGTASLAWSPNGNILAVSRDKEVALWEGSTKLISVINSFEAPVNRLAWSLDGKILAIGSGYDIQLWSNQGQKLATIAGAHTANIRFLVWSPDSKLLTSSGGCLTDSSLTCDERVRLWQADGSPLATLPGHKGSANVVSWSPDGQQLATEQNDANSGNAGSVRIWSRQGGILTVLPVHPVSLANMAWNPSKTTKTLATSLPSAQGILGTGIWLWDTELSRNNSNVKSSLATFNDVTFLAWSPDGTLLAVAETDNMIRLWRPADKVLLKTLNGHTGRITRLAWSADGQSLASLAQDKTIRLWDSQGNLLNTLSDAGAQLSSIAWSPDGSVISGIGIDKAVRFWRSSDGKLISGKMDIIGVDPAQIGWSANSSTLATYSSDGNVYLWDSRMYSQGVLRW